MKQYLKPLIAAALCLLLALPALAQDAATSADASSPDLKLSWTSPTAREDGTPLPATEIAHYQLVCKHDTTGLTVYHKVDQPSPYTVKKASFLKTPGSYTCHLLTWDTDGQKSGPSNTADFDFARGRPGAAIGVKVL